jgi:hypothetical protein
VSYFVVVTFDITDGNSDDYNTVYGGFEELGLKGTIASNKGKSIALPTTTTTGTFNGQSAAVVRDDLCARTQTVFADNKLHGEIFVSAGGDWAWGHRTP